MTGEWEVIGTTDTGGYPAILRSRDHEGIVSASLNTVGDNKKYQSAVLGYGPDVGSFGIATVRNRSQIHNLFGPGIEYYADSSDFEHLKSALINSNRAGPVAVVVGNRRHTDSPSYTWRSRSFVWFQTSTHRPWDVLTNTNLRSYQTLIERYAEAASAVDRVFNTTPPEDRRDSIGDSERGQELQAMFKKEFDNEDPNIGEEDTQDDE